MWWQNSGNIANIHDTINTFVQRRKYSNKLTICRENIWEDISPQCSVGSDIPCHLKCPPRWYLLLLTGWLVSDVSGNRSRKWSIYSELGCSEVGSEVVTISLSVCWVLSIRFTLVKCIMYNTEHYMLLPSNTLIFYRYYTRHYLGQSRYQAALFPIMIFTQSQAWPNCTFHHNR